MDVCLPLIVFSNHVIFLLEVELEGIEILTDVVEVIVTLKSITFAFGEKLHCLALLIVLAREPTREPLRYICLAWI